MSEEAESLAQTYFKRKWANLSARERRVVESLINRQPVSRNLNLEIDDKRTFGEKVADRVASFGGSWTFIGIFGGVLIFWVILNSFILLTKAFDPYPYILLNLFLSMLAATSGSGNYDVAKSASRK